MPALKLFADVLQEYSDAKKTGALFVSVAETSENLIRFYFNDGSIYTVSYGPFKDKDCLDVLDCYSLGKAVYFDGMKALVASKELPKTQDIIANLRRSGKQVQVG